MPGVEVFSPATKSLRDFSRAQHPSMLFGWDSGSLDLFADATHYGFVNSGQGMLSVGENSYSLGPGMYFCAPGNAKIHGDGRGFVASRIGYRGLFQIGGPIEQTGRLQYIDGCSDTMLIGPPVLGDPCLNLLHIPPHTLQTSHTHPTERLGMIVSGYGTCRTPNEEISLAPGMLFAIAAEGVHSFNTEDEPLRVIAWHPDSDCGPSHNDHPMINRTIIDGVSAAHRIGSER